MDLVVHVDLVDPVVQYLLVLVGPKVLVVLVVLNYQLDLVVLVDLAVLVVPVYQLQFLLLDLAGLEVL
jgi:hypothetical protein